MTQNRRHIGCVHGRRANVKQSRWNGRDQWLGSFVNTGNRSGDGFSRAQAQNGSGGEKRQRENNFTKTVHRE